MTNSHIEKFKRSHHWMEGAFTATDMAKNLGLSVERCHQLLDEMRGEIVKVEPTGGGYGKGRTKSRYKRKPAHDLLKMKWVSSPTSDEFRPDYC